MPRGARSDFVGELNHKSTQILRRFGFAGRGGAIMGFYRDQPFEDGRNLAVEIWLFTQRVELKLSRRSILTKNFADNTVVERSLRFLLETQRSTYR